MKLLYINLLGWKKQQLKNDTWKIKWLKIEGGGVGVGGGGVGGRDNWLHTSNVAVLSQDSTFDANLYLYIDLVLQQRTLQSLCTRRQFACVQFNKFMILSGSIGTKHFNTTPYS